MDFAFEKIFNPERLGTRFSIILAGVGLLAFLAIITILYLAVHDRFGALENREIEANKARLESVMQTDLANVKSKSLDYAIWTDTYNFILNPSTVYSDDNLTVDSMQTYQINGASYHRMNSKAIMTLYVDLETGEPVPQMVHKLQALGNSPEINARIRKEEDFQFYTKIDGRLLLISVAQIKQSDRSGTPPGYLLFAKELHASNLSALLQLPAKIDLRSPFDRREVIASANWIAIGLPARGLDGKDAAMIRFTMRRDMLAEGQSFALTVSLGIAAMLLLLLGTLNLSLRRSVVLPLARITRHFSGITTTGKLEILDQSDRRDEIGAVESGLNAMVEQLVALRVEHEMQSFELGRTQSAIGVMHNVGNGLSPLRVLLSRLNEELSPPVQTEMKRALAELAADDILPDRRKRLIAFVRAVVQQHNEQLGMGRDKVREAGRNLLQVIETIEQAKGNSSSKAEVEKCDINLLLQTNIAVARAAVNCAFNCEAVPFAHSHVSANRILLSQVIANLLVNAAEAIDAAGRIDGTIDIQQTLVETEQGTMHQLTIADNGDGFGEEVKAKLFIRGFSTRTAKSGGHGLQWCYNTVNAMSGTLTVTSEGDGKGACAVLRLPVFNMDHNEVSTALRPLKAA